MHGDKKEARRMASDELTEVKRQRDGFVARLKLMREGKMITNILEGGDYISTTGISISQAEQSIAALERKIARLEKAEADPT